MNVCIIVPVQVNNKSNYLAKHSSCPHPLLCSLHIFVNHVLVGLDLVHVDSTFEMGERLAGAAVLVEYFSLEIGQSF